MTYAQEITALRNQVGDTRRRVHVDFPCDGSLTILQMPADTFPVLDQTGTYIIKVNGTTKAEATDYTFDKETGTIVLFAAPSNGQIATVDCSAVYLTDASWMTIINDSIKSLGDDFFKEFVDETLVATAGMLELNLSSAQPNAIAIYEFQRRDGSSSNYSPVEEYTNWRYDRDNNIIYIGTIDAFSTAGANLKIRGLKTYTLGTAVTENVDVQPRFMTVVEYGTLARYWQWRYKNVVELVSKITMEGSRTPLQELIMLSDRFSRLYEIEKGKLKPGKPARIMPAFRNDGGRP